LIGVFAALTFIIILHRNGILFRAASSLGMAGTYVSLENGVFGPPSITTPRGVERLLTTAATDDDGKTAQQQ
jgi:hypothetical protein